MRVRFIILGILLLAPAGKLAWASDETADVQVWNALKIFLNAFDNLDWPAFRACFGPNPTMFHPAAPNDRRIDTAQQFDKAWAGVFDRIRRSSGRNTAPYMTLEPKDIRTEFLSPDVVLVTFHIFNGSEIDRRTIIFRRYGKAWKIAHIHASNLKTDETHP